MRIRAGNQLSSDARTLGLGAGWSLIENDGDVEVVTGGSVTVPAPTGVAAVDWTNISAAVAKAQTIAAAGGVAQVLFPACPYNGGVLTPYNIGANYIPIVTGVHYLGQDPLPLTNLPNTPTYLPDADWSYVGGTVIQGDGTGPIFWDGTVDAGSPATNLAAETITNAKVIGFGMQNCTYGVKTGATNIQGVVYGEFDRLWVVNASQWGFSFVNYQHVTFGKLFSASTASAVGGQYYGNVWNPVTIADGNSTYDDLFDYSRALPLRRGIVFEANGSANVTFGGPHVNHLQVNSYNRSVTNSDSVTLTSSSTSIAVPDGTKYAPCLPVWFSSTANGFTQDQMYVVKTVVGNTITVGNSRSGSAVSASGSGTMTLNYLGMANLEIVGATSGSLVAGAQFDFLDLEGGASCGVWAENCTLGGVMVNALPNVIHTGIVARSATYLGFESEVSTWVDADGSCTGASFEGALLGFRQRSMRGRWYNATLNTGELQVRVGDGVLTPDLQARSNFTYPSFGMGQHVSQGGGTGTLTGSQCGVLVVTSGSPTYTLPTITDPTTTPLNSIHGAWFDIVNVGTGVVTLNTDGTQLFNFVTGLTGLTIPPGGRLKVCAAARSLASFFWEIQSNPLPMVSADNGDAAKTLTVWKSEPTQQWKTPLTATRAVALSTTGAYSGARFRIVRTAAATGASTLDVGTGPLKSLAAGGWCDVEYDGAAWFLSANGSL